MLDCRGRFGTLSEVRLWALLWHHASQRRIHLPSTIAVSLPMLDVANQSGGGVGNGTTM